MAELLTRCHSTREYVNLATQTTPEAKKNENIRALKLQMHVVRAKFVKVIATGYRNKLLIGKKNLLSVIPEFD